MRAEHLCSVSYLKPVQGCPVYTEHFKDGDAIPSGTCPLHRGTFEQQVKRSIESVFRSLGSKIAGIFRR